MSKTLRNLEEFQKQGKDKIFLAVVGERMKNSIEEERMINEIVDNLVYEMKKEGDISKERAEKIENGLFTHMDNIRKLSQYCERPVIILVVKETREVLDLTDENRPLELSECYFRNIKAISEYYSEEEINFIEEDGKIEFVVSSEEPFLKYEREFF